MTSARAFNRLFHVKVTSLSSVQIGGNWHYFFQEHVHMFQPGLLGLKEVREHNAECDTSET